MKIPGYQIVEELYFNDKTYVCRAIKLDSQKPVVLKYLNREYPTQNEITKVQYEYDIIKSLNLDGIVKVLSYEKANNSAMIVMEDTKARSLKQIMEKTKISLDLALEYFIRFCDVLSEVHNKWVIHRDIKPHNLIISPETQAVQLIDFGIAVNYFENAAGADEAIPLIGTLAYISPEQTGRMNRSVDTRTDLYSAGVLFYEVLAGVLPFNAQDSMGWVHCHIAKQPEKLSKFNSEIPEILSEIVLKLMAKNAEDRYQTAAGLKLDLQECLAEYKASKEIKPFLLATKDKNHIFRLSQKLYHREAQMLELLKSFAQAKHGPKQIALVSGVQGSGKTSFVLELNKPLVEKGGIFVFGKFEAFKKDEPLAGFIQAFKQWIKNVLILPQDELNFWKTKLLDCLSNNGKVLTNVISDLEMIIGPQPDLPVLGPSETENRFYFTFLSFIQAIADIRTPLSMALDDLHFADSSSLKLIKFIYQSTHIHHLLLVLTYNPDIESLNPFLTEIQNDRNLTELEMDLLNENHISHLISDALQDQVTSVRDLSQIVKNKTGGNPFFVKDFLNHLSRKKLIGFDLKSQEWRFHLDEINNQATTGNVVEVMLQKILSLAPKTQEILKCASCIGVHFNLGHLQNLVAMPLNELAHHLWPAIQEGLVQTQGNDLFRIKEMSSNTVYEITQNAQLDAKNWFSHERLHLAAYQMNEPAHLPDLHLKIAKKILSDSSEKELEDNLNVLLSHWNLGSSLLNSEADIQKLIEFNLRAGIKAKNATAYPLATQYFQKAIENLGKECWDNDYQLCLQLYNEAAIVAFLNHEDAKVDLYTQIVFEKAKNLFDQIAAYDLQILKFIVNDQILAATQLGLSVLKKLGVHFPLFPSTARTGFELIKSLKIVHRHLTEEKILNLPQMTDPLEYARVSIMGRLISCSFMLSQNLHVLLELYVFGSTIKNGKHPVSSFIVAGVAMLLSGILKERNLGIKYGNIALKMSEQSGTTVMESRIRFTVSIFLDHWSLPIPQIIHRYRIGEKYGLENGDIEYTFYSAAIRTYHEFSAGDHLNENHKKCEDILKTLSSYKQAQTHMMMRIMSQGVHNLKTENSPQFEFKGPFLKDEDISLAEKTGNFTDIFLILHWKAILGVVFKKHEESEKLHLKYQQYAVHGVGTYAYYMIYFYYNLSVIHLAKKYPSKRRKYLRSFKKNLNLFKQFADQQRENYQSKYFFLLAEFYYFQGDMSNCLTYFEKTIQASMENRFYHDQALACERLSEIFLDLGNRFLTQTYFETALRLFRQWGCVTKVDLMVRGHQNY